MKVLNLSDGTIFLDDIQIAIIYTRKGEPQEIEDSLAHRSKCLTEALAIGQLHDVTNGIPESLKTIMITRLGGKKPLHVCPSESPFFKRKSLLSNSDRITGPKDYTKPEKKGTDSVSCKTYFDKNKIMSIVWHGPTSDAGGYANMNRQFMFRLSEYNDVRIKYEDIPSINDMDSNTNKKIAALRKTNVPDDAPKVYGMTAPLHYDWARKKILFTMMETRRLHPDYTERCNCADHIIVPSRWCAEEFKDSGVKKPISVVPLGVDLDLYKPGVEPIDFTKNLKPFVFLSVFGWSTRKGYDVLLKSYLEEFTSDEPVSLLISSRYFGSTDDAKKQIIRNDVARVSSMVKNPKKPHLVLFGDVLSVSMMPRLYAACNCYILISRGEGFGLPYQEAAAMGLPVIGSRYSGQTDFLDDDNSYLVDVDGFMKAPRDLAMISYFYEDQEFPIFGEKSIQQTRAHMRRVFENQQEAKGKATKLRERILKEYNWDTCTSKLHEVLRMCYSDLMLEGK